MSRRFGDNPADASGRAPRYKLMWILGAALIAVALAATGLVAMAAL